MKMIVPQPSDEAPRYYPGDGALHRFEQLVAEIRIIARTHATVPEVAAILALIDAADLDLPTSERCRCGRIGIPCDRCHDPRNDGSVGWDLLWDIEERDEGE